MQVPVEITFRELEPSQAVTTRIHDYVGKLEHVFDRIVGCDVLVETPHRHHRHGRQYHVRIRLVVPGGELIASHDPGSDGSHEDVYVALRDSFLAIRRQLESHVSKLRHGEPSS